MARVILLACALVISAVALAAQQAPAFRAGIDAVSLSVTALDAQRRLVTDLQQSEFGIFEDGVRQEVTFFARRQQPIALSILLDSSASMEHHLPTLQAAASNFVGRLKPQDIAQVVDFDSRVEIRQPFTGNQSELQAAIKQTVAGGSTSLYNALYIALRELQKIRAVTEADIRRQALIVFSDGEDTSSLVTIDEVMDLAKRSDTVVYTIALRGGDTESRRFREAEFIMRQLADGTGGRWFFPAKIQDLDAVYAQIADELASQYTVGYVSANARRDGAWRRINIVLARPDVTPRARQGYYAPRSR